MKIVNIALCCPYNEGWGYHENLLPKWQRKNGNEVTLITTRFKNNTESNQSDIVPTENYINKEKVKIIRLDWLFNIWPIRILRIYKSLYHTIEQEKPDFIFIHGSQFIDASTVCKYLKNHPNVRAVADNHADLTNSAKSLMAKILHKTFWKYTTNKLNKYIQCFYGVLPIRCEFIEKMYNIPKDRIKPLYMGIDDELIESSKSNIDHIKNKYSINNNTINIVSGGKFDDYKKEILNLMKVINNNKNYKLYIYGSVSNNIKEQFESLLSDNVKYVGWLNQLDSYTLLSACDVAVFPGRHSVIWEQCVGLGVPLIVRRWSGTEHVNINNNCIFIENGSEEEINKMINSPSFFDIIKNLKTSAKIESTKQVFSYKEIAKISIDTYN